VSIGGGELGCLGPDADYCGLRTRTSTSPAKPCAPIPQQAKCSFGLPIGLTSPRDSVPRGYKGANTCTEGQEREATDWKVPTQSVG
jgi:hypothetical protein